MTTNLCVCIMFVFLFEDKQVYAVVEIEIELYTRAMTENHQTLNLLTYIWP